MRACLADPNPAIRDGIAFEALSAWMRGAHNVRAFLLSVYASASSSEDGGVRQLIGPVTAALKAVH